MTIIGQDGMALAGALPNIQTIVDRRIFHREPFFRPVELQFGRTESVAAFSRDTSPRGLSLLHRGPLPLKPAVLTVRGRDNLLLVDVRVQWCEPCGGGWYLSGSEFTCPDDLDTLVMLWMETTADTVRRENRRLPYFRPVGLGEGGDYIPAFSRDTSAEGLGLLHDLPVLQGPTVARIATKGGFVKADIDIRWCQSVGPDLYVSGARFLDFRVGSMQTIDFLTARSRPAPPQA
ncbi:MAG: hypothetical protein AB7O38_23505 [Pirellulaceae bacterium]